MLIRKGADLRYSDITPKTLYFNRRNFLAGLPAAFLAGRELLSPSARALAAETPIPNLVKGSLSTTGETVTSKQDVTHYNNFYEFGTGKTSPPMAKKFRTSPWTVSIEGVVEKPGKSRLTTVMKLAPHRRAHLPAPLRGSVVDRGAVGRLLAKRLAEKVGPRPKPSTSPSRAITIRKQMPHAKPASSSPTSRAAAGRSDAPAGLLSVGMYGETLPPPGWRSGAHDVPWKYGFKSIKSIVKIKLVEKQPPSTWNQMQPSEYGFYSNVNPKVDHPRWSQATERRLGEFSDARR